MRERLQSAGVALVRSVLNEEQLRWLLSAVPTETGAGAVRNGAGHTVGIRGLLSAGTEIAAHLGALGIHHLAAEALGRAAFPIDAIFFDKHADANWAVPAHQDVVIPVPPDVDAASVGRRRERDGGTYGEPAASVLDELVAVRLHFDAAAEESGALRVVPGSHLRGRVREADIRALPLDTYEPCLAAAGDALLMKPLVIHRSGRRASDGHRRVLHVLYAPLGGWHARLGRVAV
jgi:hypothetical protein